MQCYLKKSETDIGAFLRFKQYDAVIDYFPIVKAKPLAAGVIFELEENKFLIAGMMSRMAFRAKPGENLMVSILKLQEGTVKQGKWIPKRVLNGDEQIVLSIGDVPSCLCVELYKY